MADSTQKRMRLLRGEIEALGGRQIAIEIRKHCKVRFVNPHGAPRLLVVSASPSSRWAEQRVRRDIQRLMEP